MRGTLLGVKDTEIKKKKSQIIINATRKSKGIDVWCDQWGYECSI